MSAWRCPRSELCAAASLAPWCAMISHDQLGARRDDPPPLHPLPRSPCMGHCGLRDSAGVAVLFFFGRSDGMMGKGRPVIPPQPPTPPLVRVRRLPSRVCVWHEGVGGWTARLAADPVPPGCPSRCRRALLRLGLPPPPRWASVMADGLVEVGGGKSRRRVPQRRASGSLPRRSVGVVPAGGGCPPA